MRLAGAALFHQAKHSRGHGERDDRKCHYANGELISLEPIRHSELPSQTFTVRAAFREESTRPIVKIQRALVQRKSRPALCRSCKLD